MKYVATRVAWMMAVAICASIAHAQAPSHEAMIEQLKAKPVAEAIGSGKTRSLNGTRNLSVEAVAVPQVAAERASLSLHIQFDFNSAKIKLESRQVLANLALALQSKDLLEAKFAIEGHTDSKGSADYNLRLSQQRADSVRDFLVSQGINPSRLSTAGKGASELANKDDPQGAENRRVKIVNLQ